MVVGAKLIDLSATDTGGFIKVSIEPSPSSSGPQAAVVLFGDPSRLRLRGMSSTLRRSADVLGLRQCCGTVTIFYSSGSDF